MQSQAYPDSTRDLKHELRTPLNHIIGYTALLRDAAEDVGDSTYADDCRAMQTLGTDLNLAIDAVLSQQDIALSPEILDDLQRTMAPIVGKLTALLEQVAAPPVQVEYSADLDKVRTAIDRLNRTLGQATAI